MAFLVRQVAAYSVRQAAAGHQQAGFHLVPYPAVQVGSCLLLGLRAALLRQAVACWVPRVAAAVSISAVQYQPMGQTVALLRWVPDCLAQQAVLQQEKVRRCSVL